MNAPITPTPRVAPSADDLSQQIDTLRADLMKLAATITNDVSDGIGSAGRQIGRTGRETPGLRQRTRFLAIRCPP